MTSPLLIFSHGNSFPASTYGVMLRALERRGFELAAIEKFGHDPRYPVTSNWPQLVQQLADFTAKRCSQAGRGAILVGHSLGGFLSLMCAALHPQLGGHKIAGVVLLDSPILGGWKAAALSAAKRARLVGSISPGAVSRKRKQSWANLPEVEAHFRGKKLFASWDAQVLHDYITQGTQPADGSPDGPRVLSFDRDVETAIYNTLPHNLDALLKKHPLRCPAAFIGGRASHEMRQVGMTLTHKVTHGRIMMLDGSHLFPMERPEASAAAVEAAVLNLLSLKG
ncbi:MAG: alpha/beta hydrolase [Betaproteobacteria bacterium]